MATVSERAKSRGRVGGRGHGAGAMVPGADRMAWYFLRVSGVLLVVLALGHLVVTHYLNVPSETTFEFVANRWSNPLWRSFDWILLMAALWHGLIGLRYSITDFVRSAGWRVVGYSAIWVVGLVFTGLGSITIFTFDEAAAAANDGPLSDAFWIADLLGYSLFAFAILTYGSVVALAVWIARTRGAGGPPIYKGDVGQYAWALHRLTGVAVLFFLLVHIVDIMLIAFGQEVYDESVEFYAIPFLIPMEVALVGAVIYHTLNGLRIVAIDFSEKGVRRQRQFFWAVLIGAVVLTLPSAVVILLEEL